MMEVLLRFISHVTRLNLINCYFQRAHVLAMDTNEREGGREGREWGRDGGVKGDVMDMYCDSVVMEMANVTLMVWLIPLCRLSGVFVYVIDVK